MNPIDRGIEALLHIAGALPAFDPVALGLADSRRAAAERIAVALKPTLAPLADAVVARDADACQRYDAHVAAAMTELRRSPPSPARAPLATVDRLLYRDEEEWLDDPTFPKEERVHVLAAIDRLNLHLGNYRAWGQVVSHLVALARARPVRVCDLAAGHGGFAIALKERLGPRAEVMATDLCDEYLDLGRAQARARGVDVTFRQADATDLRALAAEGIDIILCTQSLHHFAPGLLARMIGEAARAARHSLCFIDAERGAVAAAVIGPLSGLYARSRTVLHDSVVSLRRMYFAEELGLLAALAPGVPADLKLSAERRGPGYAYLFGLR